MANLVPTYPLEGKGARAACAPFRWSPGGPGNLQPGERGSLRRARPSGGCWPWERELAARLMHRCRPWRRLPAPRGPLCVEGSRLAAVTWRAAGAASTLSECVCFSTPTRPVRPTMAAACLRGPCRVCPGVGSDMLAWGGCWAGGDAEGVGSSLGTGTALRCEVWGFWGGVLCRRLPPLPLPQQSPPCALRGRERKERVTFPNY